MEQTNIPPAQRLASAIRSRMGTDGQVAWAGKVGIDQGTVSRLLSGKYPLGGRAAGAIVRAYPELGELVVALLREQADRRRLAETSLDGVA